MALEFPSDFPFNRKQSDAAATQAATEPAPAIPSARPVAALAEAAAALPSGRDRRRAPRQTLVAKATVRSEVQSHIVASGFLSNISMSGVGFHTRRPLQIGEKYQLRVEVGPMRWASRLRVVSCQEHEAGTFDVGAEFVGNELETYARRELAA